MATLQPRTACCNAPIRYKEIEFPLGKLNMPINSLILWCEACGHILDGNGNHAKHNLKIHEV